MGIVDLRREEEVYILNFGRGENRFNRPFVDAVNAALDEVERSKGPAALVTTGGGKFYSNGLDLDWMTGDGVSELDSFAGEVDRLYVRVLLFPMATAAAINGHAFGAGAMIALAHDYRVMRRDRGYFCFPEIDIRLPFTPIMNAIILSRLHGSQLRDATLTGAHIGGEEAKRLRIVDEAVPEGEVLDRAIALVAPLAEKDRGRWRRSSACSRRAL
jgi:enoyl-CoA hydratase/carnithine racemase